MEQLSVSEAIIVSVDFTEGEDKGILLVGRKQNGNVNVINAICGQEAADIYRILTVHNK